MHRVRRSDLVSLADPDLGYNPYIAAEAESTGRFTLHVAAEIDATARTWRNLHARIEGFRRGACEAVKVAGTVAEVATIRAHLSYLCPE